MVTDYRLGLIKELFQASNIEYTNALNSFNALDTKAQSTTTIAGIFLASVLAFLNGEVLEKLVTIGQSVSVIMLGVVGFFLILATIFCLLAIKIRNVSIISLNNPQEEAKLILQRPEEELNPRYEAFLLSRIEEWIQISNTIRETNERKANLIQFGQISLSLAIISIALLLGYLLIYGSQWNETNKTCQEVLKSICQ